MSEPIIQFGATAVLGTLTGWQEQRTSKPKGKELNTGLNKYGNRCVSKLYNEKTDVQVDYESDTNANVSIPEKIGAILNGYVLTGISIGTNATGRATMSLTLHNHTTNPHTEAKSVAHGIPAFPGFGATDFLGGTAGDNADVASSSLNITCQHNDIEGALGDHLTGGNYDAKIEGSTVWNGTPTAEADAVWNVLPNDPAENNTAHITHTVNAEKGLDLGA